VPAFTFPPKLLDSTMVPANGKIAARVTNQFNVGADLVLPVGAQGIIRNGEILNATGTAPFELPATPEGVAVDLVLMLNEIRNGKPEKATSSRTVSVPDQPTITWDDLIDVVPVLPPGDYIVPPWAGELLTAKDDAETAASTATTKAADAETARVAAVAAKVAAEAVGSTNDTIIAGRINATGSATQVALSTTYVSLIPSLELVAATAYGHSYVMGDQVDAGTSWPNKVASRLRTRALNQQGVGGTMSSRTADIVLSTWVPGSRGLIMMMCLINDVRHLSGDPTGELATLEHIRAALAYLTAGAAYNAVTASNFAYSGTWTAGPVDAQGGASKQTSQVGASVEIAFNGDTCYILARTGTLASSVKITDSGTGATQTVNLGGFADAGAKVIKLSGYGAGAHTVRITAATTASPVIINAVLIPSPTPPTVVLVREGPAVAYPSAQDPVTTNAALLSRFAPALDVLPAEFPTLVLTSKLGPTGWNAATMSGPDGLHPNDAGTDCIASTAIAALRSTPFRTGQNIGTAAMFSDAVATLAFVGVPAMVNTPATSYASGQVTLTWMAPALTGGTITDYVVQYRMTGAGSWTTFAHAASPAVTATITGLTNGTNYDFQVAAVNASGQGGYSPTVTATPAAPAAPAQVTGLSAVPDANGTALSWGAPANGGSAITDYVVQYRLTSGGSWTTFAHAASSATGITVTGLTAATQYDFQVAAVNSVGAGTYSTAATAKTYRAFDNFNRADATATAGLGTTSFGALTWTAPPTTQYGITANQAKGTVGGSTADQVTYLDPAIADVTVSATVASVGDSGIVARLSDQSNFWMLRTGGSNYQLYKKVAGAFSSVFVSSVAPAAGDKVSLICSGATIQIVANGTVLYTATDSFNQTATKCGLRQGVGLGTPIFDDFGIG
jgi:lysophospholipase L1-like esterase